jgi:polyisoprenoid-binding protein YceI
MKNRFIWLGGIGLVVVIIVVAGIIYTGRFASSVNQSHTAAGAIVVTPTATGGATSVPGGTATLTSGNLRTFQIVPAQTTASYSVFENLVFENKPNNDAIGTTNSVQGSFGIQTGTSPEVGSMTIKVDLRTLKTDSSMRDNYVQQHTLETDSYPYATFVSVSTQGLAGSYTDGQTVHFQLTGNLTMHGKTNKEVFDVQGKVVGKTVTGKATSSIFMTDFGIQPPNLADIAISQNKVAISITFTANEA